MFVHVCVCCGCGCVSPYVCVCLCCVHACVCRSRQGWQEGKLMIRLRSRSKDDHRSHGNKKRLSKQFKMDPMTLVKDVY